jgi:hypothetical protein
MMIEDRVWLPSLDIWRIDTAAYDLIRNHPDCEYDANTEGYWILKSSSIATVLALKGFKLYNRAERTMKEIW